MASIFRLFSSTNLAPFDPYEEECENTFSLDPLLDRCHMLKEAADYAAVRTKHIAATALQKTANCVLAPFRLIGRVSTTVINSGKPIAASALEKGKNVASSVVGQRVLIPLAANTLAWNYPKTAIYSALAMPTVANASITNEELKPFYRNLLYIGVLASAAGYHMMAPNDPESDPSFLTALSAFATQTVASTAAAVATSLLLSPPGKGGLAPHCTREVVGNVKYALAAKTVSLLRDSLPVPAPLRLITTPIGMIAEVAIPLGAYFQPEIEKFVENRQILSPQKLLDFTLEQTPVGSAAALGDMLAKMTQEALAAQEIVLNGLSPIIQQAINDLGDKKIASNAIARAVNGYLRLVRENQCLYDEQELNNKLKEKFPTLGWAGGLIPLPTIAEKKLGSFLADKIPEWEKQLVGFPLTSDRRLREYEHIMNLHLRGLLQYACMQLLENPGALTTEESVDFFNTIPQLLLGEFIPSACDSLSPLSKKAIEYVVIPENGEQPELYPLFRNHLKNALLASVPLFPPVEQAINQGKRLHPKTIVEIGVQQFQFGVPLPAPIKHVIENILRVVFRHRGFAKLSETYRNLISMLIPQNLIASAVPKGVIQYAQFLREKQLIHANWPQIEAALNQEFSRFNLKAKLAPANQLAAALAKIVTKLPEIERVLIGARVLPEDRIAEAKSFAEIHIRGCLIFIAGKLYSNMGGVSDEESAAFFQQLANLGFELYRGSLPQPAAEGLKRAVVELIDEARREPAREQTEGDKPKGWVDSFSEFFSYLFYWFYSLLFPAPQHALPRPDQLHQANPAAQAG